MTDLRTREARHRHYFNEFELRALELVCRRLGKPLGALSREEALDHLKIAYNLPHTDRWDQGKSIAALRIALATLSTVRRGEIEPHMRDEPVVSEARLVLVELQEELDQLRASLAGKDAQRGAK